MKIENNKNNNENEQENNIFELNIIYSISI